MSLFQNSVVNKYLKNIDVQVLNNSYNRFCEYFNNPIIQQNIKDAKEEQFQEGFLRELFVKILGYTLNPQPDYNLTTELKNVKDSKKADGAIIINNTVKAVIELKGTNITDLGKIESQAFNYKNNQPDCVYVITSNFEKLRFYIENAIEHIEFNLFNLTNKEFELLYLCLSFNSIQQDLPKKIKEESVSQEDIITKKLYKDYSLFKRELHNNLVTLNPQYDALTLFKKSQKLLDRFLFLFFAEDRLLLPPNSVRLILNDWQDLKDRDVEIPLYDRFKKYFGYLNSGFKGKRYDVYAYNGGLFKHDEILDSIKIDDNLLYQHTYRLSEYDFVSEVDVNILGHIFENSLNEIEEIQAKLEGLEVDKSKTKRKKDGVFYTPKYITKYIVENTVGKLCKEKKEELNINDEDYTSEKKIQPKNKQLLVEKLNKYREWLLQITICDPACGSGAFLNQALDFLISEHKYIDELQAKLFGDVLVMSDIETSILENNLFGVDLNEESVEIAKLSLWLRTAKPNRKLNDLSNNIKCGNSLIDDPAVAGEKAFIWQKEFPKVFEKGGFDVVIGNPPYVDSESMVKNNNYERIYLTNKYKSTQGNWDLYVPFIEKSYLICKSKSYIGLITPNKWLSMDYGKSIRDLIFNKLYIILDFTNLKVFDSANISSIVFILKNDNSTLLKINDLNLTQKVFKKKDIINKNNLSVLTSSGFYILNKLYSFQNTINNFFNVMASFTTTEAYDILPLVNDNYNENSFKLINTGTIDRYLSLWGKSQITYLGKKLLFPSIDKKDFSKKFLKRYQKMNNKKLIITGIRYFEAYYDEKIEYISGKSTTILTSENNKFDKIGLCILNSKLIRYYLKQSYESASMGGGINYSPEIIRNIPFPNIKENTPYFLNLKADLMLSLNKELQELSQKFQRSIERKFEINPLPNKLQDWYLLTYADFIKELAKKKIKLSLTDEAEWEEYFESEKAKALEIKNVIETTDKEIDRMVYELYGLTEEEIKIVEGE